MNTDKKTRTLQEIKNASSLITAMLGDYFVPKDTMGLRFTWEIVTVWEMEEVGEKKTKKRQVVLKALKDSEYGTVWVVFDVWGDTMAGVMEEYKAGTVMEVELESKINEYNEKRYNNLSMKGKPRIIEQDQLSKVEVDVEDEKKKAEINKWQKPIKVRNDDDDDLPF